MTDTPSNAAALPASSEKSSASALANGGGEEIRRLMRRNSLSAFMGGLLEWYDFGLYGWAASLVFQPLFFASDSTTVGSLAAFATFGVGFVVRPLGGLIFGHIGDRVGRKTTLLLTMLLMGGATLGVGLLPTHATAGVWAAVALVLCRLIQGIAVGGEFGGAALIAAEEAPAHRRGFWSSAAIVGGPAGLVLSSLVFTAFSAMPEEQFLSWGWRFPFLLSVVVVAFGLYIRRKLEDSDVFKESLGREPDRVPAAELMRHHKWLVLRALGARLVDAPVANVFTVFGVSYITNELGGSSTLALLCGLICNAVLFLLAPLCAALSDRIGRRPVLLVGAVFMTVSPFVGFLIMHIGTGPAIILGALIAWPVAGAFIEGPMPATLTELFPTAIRCSGVSFVYQLQTILGGAMPFIAAALVSATGGQPWLLAGVLAVLGLLNVASLLLLPEVRGRDLDIGLDSHAART
ncbi:MFS transporter [Streptomyces malaysiensis]|uniref:MFS transporter n=1 Tax=Streptomyces malaysiensis TaxID=92644 RepID=UPI002B30795B|nr:MFS transporter [Streptomyces malaysiensis]